MEGVAVSVYKGIKGYCKRKSYVRLNESSSPKIQRHNRVEVAANATRRRRFWRIKVTPKIKSFKRLGPKKLVLCLRDAYVSMMVSMANTRVFASGYGRGVISDEFGRSQLKEYDDKMIIQIYKSLVVSQGDTVSGRATKTALVR